MWRSRNILATAVFLIGCISLAGAVFLSFFLPSYIEKEAMTRIRAGLGIDDFSLEVRRVGMTGIDLGGLVLGPVDAPGVAFSGLRLDFSPAGLVSKRIRRAIITGLTVRGRYENNQVTVAGLPLPKTTDDKNGSAFSLDQIPMPVEINEVVVQGGLLILEHQGGIVRLPFDLTLFPKSAETLQTVAATLVLYPMGRALEINAALDLSKKRVALSLSGTVPLAAGASIVAQMVPDLEIAGEMVVDGTAEVSLDPFHLERFRTEFVFQRTAVAFPGISLGSGRGGEQNIPMRLIVEGDEHEVQVTLADVAISSPYALTVGAQAQVIRADDGAFAIHGRLAMESATKVSQGNYLGVPLPIRAEFDVDLDTEKKWRIRADGVTAGLQETGAVGPVQASSGIPSFAVTGTGRKAEGQLDISLQVPHLEIVQGKDTARTSKATLTAKADINKEKIAVRASLLTAPLEIAGPSFSGQIADVALKVQGTRGKNASEWQGTWGAVFGKIDGASKDASTHLPGVKLSGSAGYNPGQEQAVFVKGGLDFADGTATMPDQKISFSGISGTIPFHWPVIKEDKADKAGKLSINTISWQQRPAGSFSATLLQAGEKVSFDGRHANILIPGLNILFKGIAGIDPDTGVGAHLDFSVPLFTLANFAPATFFPAAGGLIVKGEVLASGSVTMVGGRLDGSATIGIDKGQVEDFEKKLLVEDISLDLVLPELPRIRSGPAQLLQFSKASFGEIKMDRGELAFQIESPSSFFVEKGNFSWSRGYVYVYALRILPEKSDYTITLYCDRLNFAQVLKQFGIAQVTGEGTVNGRIPLSIIDGNIRFDDGFLYSSPGEGGVIRMEAAEMLSAGIPKNTPQFSQIDFAASALKNFKYNWVRLLFQSEGEDLIMRMRLDGKPAERLPFAYQREIGSFVRLEVGSKEGIMQPILLDANFRLPFNTLLGYSSNLNDILKKMQ